MVGEVRSKIEKQAALRGIVLPRHSSSGRGTPAVHGGFEVDEAAKEAVVQELFEGEEIAVPAAAVEGREQDVARRGQLDKFRQLRRR